MIDCINQSSCQESNFIWMVYSQAGTSDLFLILGFMISNVLYLSFSTLHSSSLWRTDTFFFAKLSKPPLSNKPPSLLTHPSSPSNVFLINKPPPPPFRGGLNRRFTVSQSSSTKNKSCGKWSYLHHGKNYLCSIKVIYS